MTQHDPATVLPKLGYKMLVEAMIHQLDFRVEWNDFTLRPSWFGCTMATTIDNEHIRQSWAIIVAYSCQNFVVMSLVWKRGDWMRYPCITDVLPDARIWLSITVELLNILRHEVDSWKSDCPDSYGSHAKLMWNGRFRDWILEAKWPPWKEYTAQLNCRTCWA